MDVPEFKQLIAGSKISQNIHVLGFRPDVLNIVKSCNAFVLPSIKGEAITKAVIESMCLGIPPVITDIEGNRGLVENGRTGLVIPSKNPTAIANAMLKLYYHQHLCKTLGSAARAHIAHHLNINNTVTKFANLYTELVNTPSESRALGQPVRA